MQGYDRHQITGSVPNELLGEQGMQRCHHRSTVGHALMKIRKV